MILETQAKKYMEDKSAYDLKANELAQAFNNNFNKYSDFANHEMLDSAQV